jgi:hypothetical protein
MAFSPYPRDSLTLACVWWQAVIFLRFQLLDGCGDPMRTER